MLEKALNTRAKLGLNYENSQSQSFTESQTHEEPSKNDVSLATGKSETITRQRRSSMYAEANEKEPKHITRQTEKKQEHKTPEKATTWSPGQR